MLIKHLIWYSFLCLITVRPFINSWAYPDIDLIWNLLCSLNTLVLLFTEKNAKLKPSIMIPLVLFLLAMTVSGYRSLDPSSALKQIYEFFNAILIFWLTVNLDDKKKKVLIFTIFIPSILIAIYALDQYFIGFKYALNRLKLVSPDYQFAQRTILSKRVFATFLSPDMLAGYLILLIPINIALLIQNFKNKKRAILLSIYLFMLCITLILTKSLGGWISLLICLALFTYLLSKTKRFYSYDYLILSIILAAVSIIILTSRWQFFFDLKNPHNSIVQRYYCYKTSLEIISNHPLGGIGLGNFRHYYQRYKPDGALFAGFSHNSYLQLWAEAGFFGIAFFFWFVIVVIYDSSKRLKKNKNVIYLGLCIASISFLIHNTLDSTFFLAEVSYLWWIILGFTN
jgi:O-antigen ligase